MASQEYVGFESLYRGTLAISLPIAPPSCGRQWCISEAENDDRASGEHIVVDVYIQHDHDGERFLSICVGLRTSIIENASRAARPTT